MTLELAATVIGLVSMVVGGLKLVLMVWGWWDDRLCREANFEWHNRKNAVYRFKEWKGKP